MDRFFLRHPHLDLSSYVMHGSERLRGIGSYADVYQAALKTAPSLKAASTAVNAALSLSSTVLYEAANRGDDAMAAAENTLVALKRFRIHLNGDDVGDVDKMIMREFSIWGKLRHKNVLPLLGYCTHNDAPTMISPWMGNGSIMDYWKENDGKPGARTLIDIVADIASGLEYLHSEDVLHCDLKCANILSGPDGVPLLADFGISRLPGRDLTQTRNGDFRGTLRWMSPELIGSADIDPDSTDSDASIPGYTKASDVWAYGMTVLELWSKNHPYSNKGTDAPVILAILQNELPAPPIVLASTSLHEKALWTMCTSCWRQTPRDRPSMINVLNALQHLQQNQASDSAVEDMKSLLTGRALASSPATGGELAPTSDAIQKALQILQQTFLDQPGPSNQGISGLASPAVLALLQSLQNNGQLPLPTVAVTNAVGGGIIAQSAIAHITEEPAPPAQAPMQPTIAPARSEAIVTPTLPPPSPSPPPETALTALDDSVPRRLLSPVDISLENRSNPLISKETPLKAETPHLFKVVRETERILRQVDQVKSRVSTVSGELRGELKDLERNGGGNNGLAELERGLAKVVKSKWLRW